MFFLSKVAGWLERKCEDLIKYDDEEPLVTSEVKEFVEDVSRGSHKVPHQCTYELVRFGQTFVKTARHRACCRYRLVRILTTMQQFYDIGPPSDTLLRRLGNVLLNKLHNLEKDQQTNELPRQTDIKKSAAYINSCYLFNVVIVVFVLSVVLSSFVFILYYLFIVLPTPIVTPQAHVTVSVCCELTCTILCSQFLCVAPCVCVLPLE